MKSLIKAVLILNAKKGWSDAARKKAAMKRKRKSAPPALELSYKLSSTSPAKIIGVKNAVYKSKSGEVIHVSHSKFSSEMRRGSTLGGYSTVIQVPKGGNIFNPTVEKTFKGDGHEQKAVRFLKKSYGIEHDHRSLKEFKG